MSITPNSASIIQTSGINFGTSGARGLVSQFTDEVCQAFASSFIDVMRRHFTFDRVALAIDLRPSSPAMAAACAAAIHSAGLEVDFYGVIPTPALAYQALQDKIPAIMITGSHIPFDRNGIKFYRPDGEIDKADEAAILFAQVISPVGTVHPLPHVSDRAKRNYMERYLSIFPGQPLANKTLGLYEHSSAGRDLNRELLQALGATVISLGRTEEFVPIDTEAVSIEDQQRGLTWAQQYDLDAIISTDGDGDRPLIGDEKGHWLRGDIVGLLCAQYLNIDTLAVPVSCNTAIEQSGVFSTVLRTRIGSPYVIEGMQTLLNNNSRVAGFEANGGFLLASEVKVNSATLYPLPTRDALLPVLALLTFANTQQCPLSGLLSKLPTRFTASDRVTNFPTEQSQSLIATWTNDPSSLLAGLALPTVEVSSINQTDGLRMTLNNADIIHLRPSGNAPELRCYTESDEIEKARQLTQQMLTFLERSRSA